MVVFAVVGILLMSPCCLAITVASPPMNKFLQNCQVKIAECGLEVFNGIFKGTTVSPNCCHKLKYMGKPCHDGLVTYLISLPSFKGKKDQILASSKRTWDSCASVPY